MLLAAGAKPEMLRKYVNVVASPDKGALLDLLAKYDSRGVLNETERDQRQPECEDQE